MSCSLNAQRMNVKPGVWGPHAWVFLYTISFGYADAPTESDQQSAKQLMLSLQDLLPCERCRLNFGDKLDGGMGGGRLTEAVRCRDTFLDYIYDLEASVAATNGKTVPPQTEVVGNVMTQRYVASATGRAPNLTLLWILLPVVAVLGVSVTWAVTRGVVRAKYAA